MTVVKEILDFLNTKLEREERQQSPNRFIIRQIESCIKIMHKVPIKQGRPVDDKLNGEIKALLLKKSYTNVEISKKTGASRSRVTKVKLSLGLSKKCTSDK